MKNMNAKHQINESHLGTESTADEARRMASILTEMGYPSEYNATQGVGTRLANRENEDDGEIPESVWMSALNKLAA